MFKYLAFKVIALILLTLAIALLFEMVGSNIKKILEILDSINLPDTKEFKIGEGITCFFLFWVLIEFDW